MPGLILIPFFLLAQLPAGLPLLMPGQAGASLPSGKDRSSYVGASTCGGTPLETAGDSESPRMRDHVIGIYPETAQRILKTLSLQKAHPER